MQIQIDIQIHPHPGWAAYRLAGLHGHLRGFFPNLLAFHLYLLSASEETRSVLNITNSIWIWIWNIHPRQHKIKIQNKEYGIFLFLSFSPLSSLNIRRNKVSWHKLADPAHQGFLSRYHTLGSYKTLFQGCIFVYNLANSSPCLKIIFMSISLSTFGVEHFSQGLSFYVLCFFLVLALVDVTWQWSVCRWCMALNVKVK